MKYLIVTVLVVFANQAGATEGLNAAFQAALANSEQDHQKQQVAFDVAPDQVEKATFKRFSEPKVIDVPANISTDMPTILKEVAEPQPEAQPATDEMAALRQEVSDIH